MTQRSSRLEGFYKLEVSSRRELLAEVAALSPTDLKVLASGGLSLEQADHLAENAVGVFGLPLGVAANFKINDKDYVIPMVTEEPSIIAACSHAAKLARESGGFRASADEPLMVGQVQVVFDRTVNTAAVTRSARDAVCLVQSARESIEAARQELLRLANEANSSLVQRGGGARDITVSDFAYTDVGPMVIVHLILDTRDAMGANLVNTACEKIAPRVAELAGGRANLRILTNLADRRLARAGCRVSSHALGGTEVTRGIIEAQVLANIDPYRAATHNKGIMNGIDAVTLATGNDWRAIEAGAHAYAARRGSYGPLTRWEVDDNGDLVGSIELPMAVGIVGGMTKLHPVAQLALKILGVESAQELAGVIAAVGLAQNLAALRALAAEGIQRGHMKLHARRTSVTK